MVDSSGGHRPPRVCVLGAPGDTGNLGVTALLAGTLTGLAKHLPDADVTVFDNGLGARPATLNVSGAELSYRQLGLRVSRRYHRPESLANVRLAARLGGRGNPATRAIASADAVLDISGGDSFTDLYSRRQQRLVFEPKQLVLAMRRPLVLLPQTYGPFATASARDAAAAIVQKAAMAWARDPASHLALTELLVGAFDPARHRQGVDVAFQLERTPPTQELPSDLRAWLRPGRSAPVAGVNASGLLHEDGAQGRYGLTASCPGLLETFLRRLLEETDANVVLVAHVLGQGRRTDDGAIDSLHASVPAQYRDRVLVAPKLRAPGEVKWLLSQLDWLVGARMHATIAALSTGVPATALAYSPKAWGVFATCGLEDEVVDLRQVAERAAVDRLLSAWHRRAAVRDRLARHLPGVTAAADDQAQRIAAFVRRCAAAAEGPSGRRMAG